MSLGLLLLVVLFFLTIACSVAMKICSHQIDHRTAAVFTGAWTLAGLAATWPFQGHLWHEGLPLLMTKPWVALLAAVKGVLMFNRYVRSQKLTQVSLSSSNYVRPMSVGLIAVVNFLLGETLTRAQWGAALGLCLLSVGFFFKGHLSDFTRREKMYYADLVGFNVALAAIDYVVIKNSNWMCDLLIYNVVLLAIALVSNRRAPEVLKAAFLHRSAIVAGLLFTVTEQVKFYQQVTINPISLVITVQALTQPVIMALSALIWKERTVREQLVWGVGAFILVVFPFLITNH